MARLIYFLACDKEALAIKGIDTPVAGEADILLFPSLESCNPFYKGLMQFGRGELAGMLRGTTHPVVLMSRSESEKSKFYCIALSCLMAELKLSLWKIIFLAINPGSTSTKFALYNGEKPLLSNLFSFKRRSVPV